MEAYKIKGKMGECEKQPTAAAYGKPGPGSADLARAALAECEKNRFLRAAQMPPNALGDFIQRVVRPVSLPRRRSSRLRFSLEIR
jgi:hypothetical protein